MSDLSQTILRGTDQMSEGYQSLARVRSQNRSRQDAAIRAATDSLGEAAKNFKDYGSWQDAKAAEKDVLAAGDAARLGRIKAGAPGVLTALDGYAPSTVDGMKAAEAQRKQALEEGKALADRKYQEVQQAHIVAIDAAAANKQQQSDEQDANRTAGLKAAAKLWPDEAASPAEPDYSTDPRFSTPLPTNRAEDWYKWKERNVPEGDVGSDYDYVGAFLAGADRGGPDGHLPDTFKKPNHPTFSNESQYAPLAPDRAGTWDAAGQYVAPSSKAGLRALTPAAQMRQREVQSIKALMAADAIDPKDATSRLAQLSQQQRQEEKDAADQASKAAVEQGRNDRAASSRKIQQQNADTASARGEAYASHLDAQETNDAAGVRLRGEANQIAERSRVDRFTIAQNHDNVQLARTMADQARSDYEDELKSLDADKKLAQTQMWRPGEDKAAILSGIDVKVSALKAAHAKLLDVVKALPQPGPMKGPAQGGGTGGLTDEQKAQQILDALGK